MNKQNTALADAHTDATMRVKVDRDLTRRVAHLARLKLSDAEIDLFTTQISHILGYVGKLQEAQTEGVEPMSHPFDLKAILREDTVVPSPINAEGQPKVLDSAPDVLYGGFKVPPIL